MQSIVEYPEVPKEEAKVETILVLEDIWGLASCRESPSAEETNPG
jgi:hypothetical protein